MKRQYLWIWGCGLLVLLFFGVPLIKQLTGNAIPRAIGFDLANLLFALPYWIAIGMVVIGLFYNRRQDKRLKTQNTNKTNKDK